MHGSAARPARLIADDCQDIRRARVANRYRPRDDSSAPQHVKRRSGRTGHREKQTDLLPPRVNVRNPLESGQDRFEYWRFAELHRFTFRETRAGQVAFRVSTTNDTKRQPVRRNLPIIDSARSTARARMCSAASFALRA